ncbi:Hypothetical protein NTJ_15287 [Nesidiocoris tenuis]|uniref:Secreted protein n=1 Tax=Nesidiocoris tenuis TaxID=355587 RepID=A0ABN7BDT0_9HEMI|nr:Hypothetical protein NTJ_15287 [Nesidiocoris tenuis]
MFKLVLFLGLVLLIGEGFRLKRIVNGILSDYSDSDERARWVFVTLFLPMKHEMRLFPFSVRHWTLFLARSGRICKMTHDTTRDHPKPYNTEVSCF